VNVYNTKEYDEDEINDFYYHAKHTLINEEHNATWGDYILYSQVIINISRVWALVFYILVILMFLRFLITLYRPCIHLYRKLYDKKKESLRNDIIDIVVSVGLIALCIFGYFIGTTVWKHNEYEIDSKIYGVYKSQIGKTPLSILKPIFIELNNQKEGKKNNFEASGVTHTKDHIIIINDKDNYLYYSDKDSPKLELKTLEMKEFVDHPKFEDIFCNIESNDCYVVGAHKNEMDKTYVLYKVKLKNEEGKLTAEHVDELSKFKDGKEQTLKDSITKLLGHPKDDKKWIEGIAVVEDTVDNKQSIYLGIRDDNENKGGFELIKIILKDNKIQSVDKLTISLGSESIQKDGMSHEFHLSGLTMLSDSEILILATTEDENNGFHGNKIFKVDLSNCKETICKIDEYFKGNEFEYAQKAEGISKFKTEYYHSDIEKFVIVFDNDLEDTKQPSRLLIINRIEGY